MGTASAYLFRVFSHSVTSYSISEEKKYTMDENVKRRAVTAGLIGGILVSATRKFLQVVAMSGDFTRASL